MQGPGAEVPVRLRSIVLAFLRQNAADASDGQMDLLRQALKTVRYCLV